MSPSLQRRLCLCEMAVWRGYPELGLRQQCRLNEDGIIAETPVVYRPFRVPSIRVIYTP